jgi:hypothetical protein
MHAPCAKPTLMRTDSDDWIEFISKPALKYILRFLTGLATDHEPTQVRDVDITILYPLLSSKWSLSKHFLHKRQCSLLCNVLNFLLSAASLGPEIFS